MGLQKGRNVSGLTGLIDLPGLGTGVKFYANIVRWNARQGGATKPRRGRSGGVYARPRWILSGGSGAASGDLQTSGWPSPDAWQGQEGTITVQVDTSKTIAIPIVVTTCDISFDTTKKTPDDIPKIAFGWEATGAMVFSGWSGTQPSATAPSKADQIQWDGSTKTIDPDGLQTSAVRIIDIWGTLTDSDAAEQTKLLAVIAAAAAPLTTPHNAKLRTSTFARDALDGGTITEQWSLTTPAEDAINAATQVTIDPSGLQSNSNTAAFNAAPSAPTTLPFSGGTWKARGQQVREFNDSMTLNTYTWGERTTIEDIERPGTFVATDPSDLATVGKQTNVITTSATTPTLQLASGQQLVSTRTSMTDSGHIVLERETGKDTNKQKWEQQHSQTTTDANILGSSAAAAAIDDSTPTGPGGNFVKRVQTVQLVTNDHTGYVDEYGLRDTVDDVQMPGSEIHIDSGTIKLESSAQETQVYHTVDGVTDFDLSANINPPADTKVTGVTSQEINRVKSKAIARWGYRTRDEEIVAEKKRTEIDVSGLNSRAVTSELWLVSGGAPSTPTLTNFVLRDYADEEVSNPLYRLRVYLWGLSTHAQDIEFVKSIAEADPLTGYKTKLTTIVSATGTSIATLRGSYFTTNQSTSSYAGSIVNQGGLPADKYAVTHLYDFEDKRFHSQSNHAVLDALRGKPSTWGSADGQLLIQVPGAIIGGPGGFTTAKIVPYFVWRTLGTFKLRRIYNTDDPTTYFYLATKGKVNNGTFLGHASHELMYVGPSVEYIFSISGAHRVVIDYEFRSDNHLFVNDGLLPIGKASVSNAVSPFTVSGWYDISYTSWSLGFTWPEETNFAGFLL